MILFYYITQVTFSLIWNDWTPTYTTTELNTYKYYGKIGHYRPEN